MIVKNNEITCVIVSVCLIGPFDIVLRLVGGGSIKSRRGVVWIEASFKRLIIGGGEGDRALLRYWLFGKLITTFWSDEDDGMLALWNWRS